MKKPTPHSIKTPNDDDTDEDDQELIEQIPFEDVASNIDDMDQDIEYMDDYETKENSQKAKHRVRVSITNVDEIAPDKGGEEKNNKKNIMMIQMIIY